MRPAARRLRLGTRGSALALAQSRLIAARLLELHPGLEVEEIIIRTRGDEVIDSPLHMVGGKGLFVKELEEALLDGRVDFAVHSLKDLPGELPPGLTLGAVPEREEPWDVLVSRGGESIRNLAPGSRVGTSSLRRRAQLFRYRPDLEIVDLRGNVDTRLRKVAEGQVQAAILASAGLRRLGRGDRATEALAPEIMLPAVAQGALGIEAREGDAATLQLLAALEHSPTRQAVEAERRVMAVLEGGCKVPMAAFAEPWQGRLRLRALVASLDGKRLAEASGEDDPANASALGERIARQILASGGGDILSEIERA